MRLIVAEKPSMGRAIAQALGVHGSGRESIEGGGVIVTWAIGHLGELAMPEDYDAALRAWTWGTLPFIPERFQIRVTDADTRTQFEAIRRLMAEPRVTEVVNACDSGREGEYIFDLIYRLAGCRKPVLRLWTASLTEEAIRQAYQSMKPGSHYAGLRDAARCRSEADWLVGLNGTRAQTLYVRMKKLPLEGVASIGRVQTPVLMLLYQRHRAIQDFVPQDFWTVLADFQAPAGAYTGKWFRKGTDGKDEERFLVEAEAKALLQRLAGQAAEIESVVQKDEKKAPEPLYDLTTLQRECNKRFGFTAEHTLKIAQALYEAKITTYPRTDSRHLTPDVAAKMGEVVDQLATQAEYARLVEQGRAAGYFQKTLGKRFVDASRVEDHHAIIPTAKAPAGALPEDERRVYDLVVRRTLAMYWPERVDAKTTILTRITEERFRTTGTVCKAEGWTAIDPPARGKERKDTDAAEAAELPAVQAGERPTVQKLYTKKGKTTPPRPYTEGDLLGAMETAGRMVEDEALKAAMKDAGLGTPATRAATIETLLKRKYVERRKTTLEITPAGVALIESIPDEVGVIKSPELTGKWEAKLAQIARGQYERSAFMGNIHEFTRRLVATIGERAGTLEERETFGQSRVQAKPLGLSCFKCRKGTLDLVTFEGKHYAACSNRKAKKCDVWYDADTDGQPLERCVHPGCGGPIRTTKNGHKVCAKCDRWQDTTPRGEDSGLECDRCHAEHYRRITTRAGGAFLACPNCEFTRDLNAVLQPGACPTCGADALAQPGRFGGTLLKCTAPDCAGAAPKSAEGRSPIQRTPTRKTCPKCRKQKLTLLQGEKNGRAWKRLVCTPECGHAEWVNDRAA